MKNSARSLLILCLVSTSFWACNESSLRKRSFPMPSAAKATGTNTAVTPEQMACLTELKTKAVENRLEFFDEPNSRFDNEIVAQANQQWKSFVPADQIFSFHRVQQTNRITSLGYKAWTQPDAGKSAQSFMVNISPNDKTALSRFNVNLEFVSVDELSRPVVMLSQEFSVTAKCQLTFNSTKLNQYEYSSSGNIKMTRSTFYSDTGDKSHRLDGQLNEGEVYYHPIGSVNKTLIHQMSQKNVKVTGSDDTLFAQLRVLKETDNQLFKNDLSHQEARGTEIQLATYMGETKVMELIIQDASPVVFKYIVGSYEVMQIDKDLWMQTAPSEKLEGSQLVKVDIKEDLENDFHSIKLRWDFETNLDAEFLAPYWKIVEKSENSAVIENNLIFVDQSTPLNPQEEVASTPFLKETTYIQPSLPAVQKWKQELLIGFQGSRMQMAQKILEKVTSILVYDHEMIKNNIIRPLKTEEVLQKKNGVCQHFANLFTAIARSVGIPTRIISGLLLDAKRGGAHAWVEVEIRPGVWRPLEPQSSQVSFNTKRYFPLAVSAVLDDPNNGDLLSEEMRDIGKTMSFRSL